MSSRDECLKVQNCTVDVTSRTLRCKLAAVLSASHQPTIGDFKNCLRGPGKADRQLLRKIHDFFGWMAKGGPNSKKGHCKGCMYRSKSFLEMPVDQRCGAKADQTIHVEHAIPIKLLPELIWDSLPNHPSAFEEAMINKLVLQYSVSVAVTICEKRKIDRVRTINGKCGSWRSNHPETVDQTNPSSSLLHPFLRYKCSGAEIYSMVTGECIDVESYTIADHFEALQEFKWFSELFPQAQFGRD